MNVSVHACTCVRAHMCARAGTHTCTRARVCMREGVSLCGRENLQMQNKICKKFSICVHLSVCTSLICLRPSVGEDEAGEVAEDIIVLRVRHAYLQVCNAYVSPF